MVAFAKPTTAVLQVWKTSFLPVCLYSSTLVLRKESDGGERKITSFSIVNKEKSTL